jgi:hypothetical protein
VHWTQQTLPSNITDVAAVHAFSPDEAWAAVTEGTGNNAVLYLTDGGIWVPALETASPDPFTDLSIIASPARIAVVEAGKVYECDRSTVSCRSTSDWQVVPIDDFTLNNLHRLCNDGTRFYATGDTSGGGALFTHTGGVYQLIGSSPHDGLLGRCAVIADGSVLAPGWYDIAWYTPGIGITQIPIVTPYEIWATVHAAGGRIFVGGEDRTLIEMFPDGGYTVGLNPGGPAGTIRAIAGVDPTALIAAGDDNNPYGTALFDGSTWSSGPSILPGLAVRGISALDAHTFFCGGQTSTANLSVYTGHILRGTR